MTTLHPLIEDRRAWVGADFRDKREVVFELPPALVTKLFERAARLAATGKPFAELNPEALLDPKLADVLRAPFLEVRDGRGFVVLSPLPVEAWPLDVVKYAYWGLGAHLGRSQSQSNLGDLVGEVKDVTDVDPHARGYRNNQELSLHTDICDMISLLVVRAAQSGGDSSVASAFAVHNLFLKERSDLLPTLYQGARNHRRGEQAPDEAPVTPHRVPVFSVAAGALSLRYVRSYITHGLRATGEDNPALIEALDVLEAFAERVKTTFRLEPGEVLLLNNLTTLHARSAFVDAPEPEQKRLLLRLWLNSAGFRPLDPNIHLYGEEDGIPYVAGRTSSYAGFE